MKRFLFLTLSAVILIFVVSLTSCEAWNDIFQQSTSETTTTTQPLPARTTITEDEWDACAAKNNFTVDFTTYGSSLKIRMTEDDLELIAIGEHIFVDRENKILYYDTGWGWCAYVSGTSYDEMYIELGDVVDVFDVFDRLDFSDLVYNENEKTYLYIDIPFKLVYKFEDGELTDIEILSSSDSSKICDVNNIGTTLVEFPEEYMILDDGEPTPSKADSSVRTTIDGDEWDENITGSYTIRMFSAGLDVEIQCDGDTYVQRMNSAVESKLEYYVRRNGTVYKLEYTENKFVAKEVGESRLPYVDEVLGSLSGDEYLMGDWEDFTYNEEGRFYECDGIYLYFEEGKLVRATRIEGNIEMVFFASNMGSTEVVVPKYELEAKGPIYELDIGGTGYIVVGVGKLEDTDVIILDTYDGKPVVAIADGAFDNCATITGVTIPDTVTSIGDNAFRDCSLLESIVIPDSVISIGAGAFSGCSSLQSISISNSVIKIGDNAFDDCNSLEFNSYGNTLYLGNDANPYFVLVKPEDYSLSSYEIHPDTKVISDCAFNHCSSLTDIVIPDSVIAIGNSAFSGCSSLESITLSNSLVRIGTGIFGKCDMLKSTEYGNACYLGSEENPYIILLKAKSEDIDSVEIKEKTVFVYEYAFYNCNKLKSVVIPNSVVSIGHEAFMNCYELNSVSISNSVVEIGYGAFQRCSSLTSIVIPNSVTDIGRVAFEYCHSLESVTLSDSLTVISDGTFSLCYSIKYLEIPDSVISIGEQAFYNCSALENVVIPNSVVSIGKEAFSNCKALTRIVIPESVTEIGEYVFYGCKSVEVYCKASTQPEGWHYRWNYIDRYDVCSVDWNYKEK